MNKMLQAVKAQINDGLTRSAITNSADWAEKYRVMSIDHLTQLPNFWSFDEHPWSRALHESNCHHICGRKAAQMGYTEVAINRSFYAIDILQESVMYVLPTVRPDAVDFSSTRFDPALEMSPHLKGLFSDTKNLGLKRAGIACLYIRSGRSRSQLKSAPTARVVIDEQDEIAKDMVKLAKQRTTGQLEKTVFEISTPTIPGHGIDLVYQSSTMCQYAFKCPSCGRSEIMCQDHLKITADDKDDPKIKNSYYACIRCGATLPHKSEYVTQANCEWVPEYKNRMTEGYTIPQFYSYAMAPWEMAVAYMESFLSPTDKQEYYNSQRGEPVLIEGAKLDEPTLRACMTHDNFHMLSSLRADRHVTMGVDVGTWLNVEINEWSVGNGASNGKNVNDVNLRSKPTLVKACKVKDFEELDGLMDQYRVNMCVIDKDPERRKAIEFRNRYPARVWLCNYANAMTGSVILKRDVFVSLDRTSWLDLSLGRFKRQDIILPVDTPQEYLDNLQSPVRVYQIDKDGNPVGRYLNEKPDHYAHCRNYNEIAFALSMGLGRSESIETD